MRRQHETGGRTLDPGPSTRLPTLIRVNRETGPRADVVGIFPEEAAIVRRVDALVLWRATPKGPWRDAT